MEKAEDINMHRRFRRNYWQEKWSGAIQCLSALSPFSCFMSKLNLLLEEWDDKKDDILEQIQTPGLHSIPLRDTGHFLEQVACICVPGQQDNAWPLALGSSPRRSSFYQALTAGRAKNQKNPAQIGTVPFNVHNDRHCSQHMMTAAAVGSVPAHEWK